ncbi:MAG TPA: SDR family oxidoreductase [Acidimicrobiales bacterium]|nr:SDR family oxidoreductase [Acidimicrobiales bacterium]
MPPERLVDLVATDLTGYFLVARAFVPGFVAAGRGRFVNVTMNHESMRRRGFVPYGPGRAGAEALSLIMTEDLREHGVAVNLLLPGGATATGMIPDELPEEARARLLPAAVMGPPAVFLASRESDGLTGARIVARDFEQFLSTYRAGGGAAVGS